MRNFDSVLEGFLDECRARGIGQQTIDARRRELNRWSAWLRNRKPRPKLEDVNSELIIQYIKSRSAFRSKASVAGVMSHLRCFGDYLSREGVWRKNSLKWMQSPKITVNSHIPKTLKRSEIESFLTEAFKSKESLHQYLWPAVILCLFTLGIRRGELVALSLQDWDQRENVLRITHSKVGRQRYMPVPESVKRSLDAYLQIRFRILKQYKKEDCQALFVTKYGEPLSQERVSMGLSRIAKRAKITGFSTHQLRHTCATQLIESGVPLPEVKMVLGHATIDTTMRYIHVCGPEKKKAIELHPINKMLEAMF